jgi:Flp pilus assembly pilin Flp
MVRDWRRFWDDEAGAELVEWAVVAVIVLLTTVGVVYLISQEGLPHYFDAIMERLGFVQVDG